MVSSRRLAGGRFLQLALAAVGPLLLHGLRVPVANIERKRERLEDSVAEFAKGAGTVIVDGDNVRGKSNFELSHADLISQSALWAQERGLGGRVVVAIDHGSSADACYLPELGLAVCFAGPEATADDLIARAAPCFANALVITADAGLAKRCRSAMSKHGRLQVVAPQPFLSSLAACEATTDAPPAVRSLAALQPPLPADVLHVRDDEEEAEAEAEAEADEPPGSEAALAALEAEMDARAALVRAERQVLPPAHLAIPARTRRHQRACCPHA